MVNVEHLVGAGDIAERLGLRGRQAVTDWQRRYDDFPKPVAHVGSRKVWLWPEIEAWARKNGLPRPRP